MSEPEKEEQVVGGKRKKEHRSAEGKAERKKAKRAAEKAKLVEEKKERIKSAKQYLKTWKSFKSGKSSKWKFQKAQQIWIIKNIYNRKTIPKSTFNDYALEYIESIQGAGRNRILEEAEKIVNGTPLNEKVLKLEAKKEAAEKEAAKTAIETEIKQIRSQHKRAEKVVQQLSKQTKDE